MVKIESFKVLKVAGTPFEMGKQRGEKFKGKINEYVKKKLSTYETLKYPREKLDKLSAKYEASIEKHAPRILDEMRGIATGANLKYDDVLLVNLGSEMQYHELFFEDNYTSLQAPIKNEEGCTAFAAYGIATTDGQPFIGKNFDMGLSDLEDAIIIIKKPSDGNTFISLEAWCHLSGDDGMNSKGLSIMGGGGHVPKGVKHEDFMSRDLKVPISLLNEVVLTECNTVDEAIEYHKKKFGGIQNRQMVVGDKETLVRSEVAYDKYRIQEPEVGAHYPANYVMAATNHFSSSEMNYLGMSPTFHISSYKRYERAMEILTSNAGRITFDTITALARDHANGPGTNSICRHGPIYSIQSMICQPWELRAWVLMGNPCENQYMQYMIN